MYLLNSKDYQTVWQLAHHWTGQDSQASNPSDLSPEIKESIHRILIAIRNDLITARTKHRVILQDDNTIEFIQTCPEIRV